jgi:hypothetical protein
LRFETTAEIDELRLRLLGEFYDRCGREGWFREPMEQQKKTMAALMLLREEVGFWDCQEVENLAWPAMAWEKTGGQYKGSRTWKDISDGYKVLVRYSVDYAAGLIFNGGDD